MKNRTFRQSNSLHNTNQRTHLPGTHVALKDCTEAKMTYSKLSKQFIHGLSMIALSFGISLASTAKADGGTSSNGNGGKAKNQWLPIPGAKNLLPNEAVESDLETQIRSYQKAHPEASLINCSTSEPSTKVLDLPKELSAKLKLYVEGEPVEINNSQSICSLESEYINLMSELTLVLRQIKSYHPIGMKIIDSIYSLGGPLKINLTLSSNTSAAVSGTITETTWYSQENQMVNWSPMERSRGIEILMGRSKVDLFVHESVHALMNRSLGVRYPNVSAWHSSDRSKAKDSWLESDWTSKEAAYIESVANALEGMANFSDHPHRVEVGNLNHLLKINTSPSQYCYFRPEIFTRSNQISEKSALTAPLANETYVTTALSALLEDVVHTIEPLDLQTPVVRSVRKNIERSLRLVEGITQFHPGNITELARAFDLVDKSGRANRWLHEYFLWDYQTNQSVQSQLQIKHHWNRNTFCVTSGQEDSFYQPLLEKEYQNSESLALIALGRQSNPKSLAHEINLTTESIKQKLISFTEHTLTVEQAEKIKFNFASNRREQICGGDYKNSENSDLEDSIYHEITKRFSPAIVPLDEIIAFRTEACEQSPSEVYADFQKTLNKLSQMAIELNEFDSSTQNDFALKIGIKYEQYVKTRAQAHRLLIQVENQTLIARVAQSL